ncbi:hypothetical protein ZOSMA_123G00230 [Zostera marina]|uniref:Protein SAMBA n=1 Tax=Zostera marina TaxID=29655 RepID=A0A0K9Q2L5_ZOSMR|nr:hypothetical protein ZOSMA_123G00230 [Zostera marina]
MSSPARSTASATSVAGQGASIVGGSTSNTGFGDDNSSYHFPIDLITAQDRKEEALKFLEQQLLTALQEEVKLMDEEKWKYAGPRSQINLISRPNVFPFKHPPS